MINAVQGRHRRQPEALAPILTQLSEAGDDLPNALELLVTYPFPQYVGRRASRATTPTCASPPTSTCGRILANQRRAAWRAPPDAAADRPADPVPRLHDLPPGLPTGCRPAACPSACPPVAAPADPVAAAAATSARPATPHGRSRGVRHEPRRPDDGGLRMITRTVKIQLVVFLIDHPRRRELRQRALHRPRQGCSSATATSSPPTSRVRAASSRTPRSPIAASPSAGWTSCGWPRTACTSTCDIDEGVEVPAGHRRRGREPLGGRRAVRRPPAAQHGGPVPRRRQPHQERDGRHPAAHRDAAAQPGPAGQLGRQARTSSRSSTSSGRRSPAAAATCSACSTPATP